MATIISLLLSLCLLVFSVFNFGNHVYQTQRINTNLLSPLEVASSFQDPKQMIPYFQGSINFLENSGIASGNTCLFFSTTPSCDLGNFSSKLTQDLEILNEVKDEPLASYEVTNALSRIHQSLYRHGESGEYISMPDLNFAIRWGTGSLFLTKMLEWFSGIVAVVFFMVVSVLGDL